MAIASPRLAGVAYISVDGVQYMLAGDLEYRVATVERETLVGQDSVHGYSEKPVAGFIKGQLRDASNLSVASINAMTNVSVIAQLANGKNITGGGMWTVSAQEVKTQEGTFDVEFQGPLVEEA
jgi:hypothetical protein